MLSSDNEFRILKEIASKETMAEIGDLLFYELEALIPLPYKIIRLKVDDKLIFFRTDLKDLTGTLNGIISKSETKIEDLRRDVVETCLLKGRHLIISEGSKDYENIFFNFKKAVYFPIKTKNGNIIGLLQFVTDKEDVKISDENISDAIKIIELFASMFNIHLSLICKKEKQESIRLYRASSAILEFNKLSTTNEILDTVLENIIDIYGFSVGYILIKEKDMLKIVRAATLSEEYEYVVREFTDYFNIDENSPYIGSTVPDMACAYAFISNHPVYIKDYLNIKDCVPVSKKDKKALEIISKPLRTVVHVPIRDSEEAMGVLELFSIDDSVVELSDEDLDTIIGLCTFIPTAIRNSRLYLELSDKNKTIEAQNLRMREELMLAKKIQHNIMPKAPEYDGVVFSSIYVPMNEVGGDLYDYIRMPEQNKVGIFLSDVSGHGVPAALITGMIKTLIQTAGDIRLLPSSLLSYLNTQILGFTYGNFITAIYSVLDISSREMYLSRAAHNFPYIIRDGRVEELDMGKGKMLGIFDEVEFEVVKICLKKGDKVLFFTDGLTEAHNKELDEIFEAKLVEVMGENSKLSVSDFVNAIYSKLVSFVGKEQFDDDVCILGMEIL